MNSNEIKKLIFIFIFMVLIGGVIYTFVEGWRFLDSIYFVVVTITTLGYGDFVPITDIGKIFTIFYSLSGIALGLYLLAVIGKYIAFEVNKKGLKSYKIERGKEFDVSSLGLNELIEWYPEKGVVFEGNITSIGLNNIRVKLIKKSNKLLPKNQQKIITITTKGRIKRR